MKDVVGIDPPVWGVALAVAKAWQIAPWELEAECSQRWWERMCAYLAALGEASGSQ